MLNLAQSSTRMGGRHIITWKILVIKFPINYFVLSFLFSQECLRLHLEECESRQVVCRSHYWGSHQSHWEPVCLLSSYVFVNSCSQWRGHCHVVADTTCQGWIINTNVLDAVCIIAFTIFFSYLPVYMWRQLNKVNQKDDFSELLHLMSAKQMHTDADFNNNRVCNKGFLHFIQNVIIASPFLRYSMIIWNRFNV